MVCYSNGSPHRCWCILHLYHGRFAASWFHLRFAKRMFLPKANGDAMRKFKFQPEVKINGTYYLDTHLVGQPKIHSERHVSQYCGQQLKFAWTEGTFLCDTLKKLHFLKDTAKEIRRCRAVCQLTEGIRDTAETAIILEEENFSIEEGTENITAMVSSNRVLQDLTGKADSVNVIAKAKKFAFRSIEDSGKTTVVAMHQADVESFRVDYHVIRNEEENGSYDDRALSNELDKEQYFGDYVKTEDGQSFFQATCNSVAHTNEDRESDLSNYQDIHKRRKQQNESSKILELVKMKKQQSLKAEEIDSRDKTISTTLSEEWFKKNPDSDISKSFRDTGLSEEKDQIETCFHEDRKWSKSQPVSCIQQEYTQLTSTDESLLLVTEVHFDASSQKCKEIYDKNSDNCLVITERPSDFISLKYVKKNKKALQSKLHCTVNYNYLSFVPRKNSKKNTEVEIHLKEAVKVFSFKKQVISSSVRAFFETNDTGLNQMKDSNEPETRIPLGMDVAVQKEKLGVGINGITGTDVDLQKKKKHHLRQIMRFSRNCLPLPRLSRDIIVGFLEEQTRDGHGGSNLPPSEHEELREMLRLLASDNVPGPQITMKYEMLRLCTLKTFPGRDRPFAIRIVGAGFYYAGHQDQVICYCCGNRKDSWVIGDIPLLIHQNMAPDCGFLTHNALVNVPIKKANSSESPSLAEVRLLTIQRFYGSNQSDTAQGESSLMLPSSEQNRRHNLSDNLPTISAHADSVEEPPPKYPQYAVKNMRINSFQGWPTELQQRPEEMAECGFYYAGFNDCVRCFHCGVGLRHWMSEDDPWIEHARWSTSCVYVLKMKGEEFVSLIKMAVEIAEREEEAARGNSGGNQAPEHSCETAPAVTANDVSNNSSTADSVAVKDNTGSAGVTGGNATGAAASTPSHGNTEIQKYLLTDAAQSVLDMGYQPKLVQRAIERVLLKKGTEELTGQIILEAVFEIEEETIVQPQPQQAAQCAEGHESIGKGSEATENTSSEESQLDLEKIKREHRELSDAKLCKICMENTISVVFLPCAHLVTCSDCAPAMRKCPICRTLIKGTVKTFYG